MTAIQIRRTLTLLMLGVLHASTVTAQTVRDTAQTDTTRKHQTLFTAGDAALAAGFVGLTIAMFPADRSITQRLDRLILKTSTGPDGHGGGVVAWTVLFPR
jgi:hypothetical protein